MAELSKYQQSVVKNYYDNLDTALLQRLGEQVTDLYLAEGKKRAKLAHQVGGAQKPDCDDREVGRRPPTRHDPAGTTGEGLTARLSCRIL